MKYIRVKWIHNFAVEPVLIYSELDENRWEHRKVEIFATGRQDYASQFESQGDARLSTEPLPSIEEIALDNQFEIIEIDQSEFNRIWTKVHR
jgi:hypothetical protein